MARFLFFSSFVLCALLVGCDEAAMMKRYAPLQDEPVARKYLDLLMRGKVDELRKDLDPNIVDLDPETKLRELADTLPAEQPRSVKVVGAHTFKTDEVLKAEFNYECEFQNAWYLVTVSLQKKGGVWTILGMGNTPLTDSLENLNRFTLWGKGINQYFVLLVAGLSLALSFLRAAAMYQNKNWADALDVGVLHSRWSGRMLSELDNRASRLSGSGHSHTLRQCNRRVLRAVDCRRFFTDRRIGVSK